MVCEYDQPLISRFEYVGREPIEPLKLQPFAEPLETMVFLNLL